jgi:hypothetical protein
MSSSVASCTLVRSEWEQVRTGQREVVTGIAGGRAGECREREKTHRTHLTNSVPSRSREGLTITKRLTQVS